MEFINFPKVLQYNSESDLEDILYHTKLSVSSLFALWLKMCNDNVSNDLFQILDQKLENTPCKWDHFTLFDDSKILNYMDYWVDYIDWYNEANAFFANMFPDDNTDQILDLLAATSRNVDIQTNIYLFNLAYEYLIFDKWSSKLTPYIYSQIQRIQDWLEISWPKVCNYARALKWDENAITVDIHVMRAFGINRKYNSSLTGSPTPLDYLHIRYYIRRNCAQYNLTPRQFTVMLWWGYRVVHNLPLKDYKDCF